MKEQIEKLCGELAEAMWNEIDIKKQQETLKLREKPAHLRTLKVKELLDNLKEDNI